MLQFDYDVYPLNQHTSLDEPMLRPERRYPRVVRQWPQLDWSLAEAVARETGKLMHQGRSCGHTPVTVTAARTPGP